MDSNLPEIGSYWMDYNELKCEVLCLANKHSVNPMRPVTVVYRIGNKVWAEPYQYWIGRFRPAPPPDDEHECGTYPGAWCRDCPNHRKTGRAE